MTIYAQESLNGSLGKLTAFCTPGAGSATFVPDPSAVTSSVSTGLCWQGQVSGTGLACIQFNSDDIPSMPPNPALDRDFFLQFDFMVPDADTLPNVQGVNQQVKVLLARSPSFPGVGGWDMDGFGWNFAGRNYQLETDRGQPGCLSRAVISPIVPGVWYTQRNYYRFNSGAGKGAICVSINAKEVWGGCGQKFGWGDNSQMRGSVGISYAQNVTGSGVRVCIRNFSAADSPL